MFPSNVTGANRRSTRGSRFVNAELQMAGVSYKKLTRRLNKRGLRGTGNSIMPKLGRETFAVAPFRTPPSVLEMVRLRLGICKKAMRKAVIALLALVIFGMALAAVKWSKSEPTQAKCTIDEKNWKPIWQEPTCFLRRASTDPVAVFTFALGLIGVAQACLFYVQLSLIRAGMDDAQNAAKAANQSAQAAIEANTINRDHFVSSQRAWLSIERVVLKPKTSIADSLATFYMDVTVRNVGETPATSVMINLKTSPNGGNIRNNSIMSYQCKEEARFFPLPLGITLFPQMPRIYSYAWTAAANAGESFKMLLQTKPVVSVVFPIAASYIVSGDVKRHIIYHSYSLAMEMPEVIGDGEEFILQPGSPIDVDDIT